MSKEIARAPEQIASEINGIKEQSDRMMLYNSVEIGRRLAEAKELIPHGEWGNWLKESVGYSQRTANYLMQISKEFGTKLTSDERGDSPNSQSIANLGFTQAVILLGIPIEERAHFMAQQNVGNMSTRELRQTVNSWDNLNSQAQGPEKQAVQKQTEKKEDMTKTPDRTAELIPVQWRVIKPKTVQPSVDTNPESIKYDAQFAIHCEDILNAYRELLRILVAQSRIDTTRKEKNRAKVLKIVTNMAETLKEYPPAVITNMGIQTGN